METKTVSTYVTEFFEDLEVYEDIARGHYCRVLMKQAVLEFLQNENKKNAFAVYRAFFDSYRIALGDGESNAFIDLLDALKDYEEHAAVLIRRQRDHYIHSVNVFILGLCIYMGNECFRAAFNAACLDKSIYPFSYDTKHEEFLYRWGLASLFHDIGYPLEIAGRQVSEFMDFIADADGKNAGIKAHLSFGYFEELNRIAEVLPRDSFTASFSEHCGKNPCIDPLKPIDLLAYRIHSVLSIPLESVKTSLNSFPDTMARFGFIDHGYYSAIIILKWYGFLIQSAGYKPEYFFWPVLDSASAVLLHNYYRNVLQKEPYGLKPLKPETHPLAFLLILCDELQEWNRDAYGKEDKLKPRAHTCKMEISQEHLRVNYICHNNPLPRGFTQDKKKLLYQVLDMKALFSEVSIRSKTVKTVHFARLETSRSPRPPLSDIERLAKAIHTQYNRKQLEMYPNQPLRYPDFESLPETLQYSNLRQAMDIPEKLHLIGCRMVPKAQAEAVIMELPAAAIETLAEEEHKSWIKERLASGWTLRRGERADPARKTSPYLIPYGQLPEDVKELDRDAVRNIPALLDAIGMAVVLGD